MKPISALTPDEAKELLFYTSPSGAIVPISKIESLSPTTALISGEEYKISPELHAILKDKLTTYEGVKLMYAQDDLAAQAKKLTETAFASNFSDYFEHLDEIINHFSNQASKAIDSIQSHYNTVAKATSKTLANLDSINDEIKPFKQFAKTTNLEDLKQSIKTNVDQLAPVKDEFAQVVNQLKELFGNK